MKNYRQLLTTESKVLSSLKPKYTNGLFNKSLNKTHMNNAKEAPRVVRYIL